jgi:hypothetical protein
MEFVMPKYSFKPELKEISALYNSALQSSNQMRDNCYSALLLGGAHIVRTRISSLDEHIRRSKPALLSASTNPKFPSRTHEFVNDFFADKIESADFIQRLIGALQKKSKLGFLTTNDLWAIPNAISIYLIRSISHTAISPDRHCEKIFASLNSCHSILAEIQNILWVDIMPKVSYLDTILEEDPHGAFLSMDAESKDLYRQSITRIAKLGGRTEKEVASQALALALRHVGDHRRELSHVGYYLVGNGTKLICSHWKDMRLLVSANRSSTITRLAFVFSAISLLCAAGLTTQVIFNTSIASLPAIVGVAIWMATTLILFEALIHLFRYSVKAAYSTTKHPRFNYERAVPIDAKTLVVIPCLLISKENILRLKEKLLMQYLRNRVDNVNFALLTDWTDSKAEIKADDFELLASAIDSIKNLNENHASNGSKFFLFHRSRIWSPSEKAWMGRARKHGKLIDLNRYLVEGNRSSFHTIVGNTEVLADTAYVITIDDDTDLSYGSVVRLVSTISHPLCKPRLSDDGKRVAHGYGLLQPTVSTLGLTDKESRYQDLVTHGVGIKIYQSSSSDFYADVLDTGSYIGKGIYDVKCANSLLASAIDSGLVLSHDIIEGGLLNSSSVSDTEIFEPAPQTYGSEMKRQERWIRGDAQNLLWLLSKPRKIAEVGVVTSWRIHESLLNHFIEPALLVAALASCGIADLSWLASGIVAYLFIPPILRSVIKFQGQYLLTGNLLGITLDSIGNDFTIAFLKLITLPHRSVVSMVALARSSYRFCVSGNYLLEWTASEHSGEVKGVTGVLISGIVLSTTCIYVSFGLTQTNLLIATFFSSLWLASPFYVKFLNSRPDATGNHVHDELLPLAWRTWKYFDQAFAASKTKIVPDNLGYQETDKRSSPTNIGMSLVAVIAANKLNLINRRSCLKVIRSALESVAKLPTCEGHLYNWYDIDDLTVIGQASISSADSANFIASITVVMQWLQETPSTCELKDIAKTYLKLADAMESCCTDQAVLDTTKSLRRLLTEISIQGAVERSDVQEILAAIPALNNEAETVHTLLRGAHECFDCIGSEANKPEIDRLMLICKRLSTPSFSFFLNPQAGLLHIERKEKDQTASPAVYDLLASEARLATFIGVAKSNLGMDNWTRLSRSKIATAQGPCLVSWNGSLFEHLFAELFAQSPRGSLLDISCRNAVKRSKQIKPGLVWGKAECAFYDPSSDHTYGPIGEIELSISRESPSRTIIAPYASILALRLDTSSVVANVRHLDQLKAIGQLGLVESISFNDDAGQTHQIMRRHYSHHQGMILASIANTHSGAITSLFFKDPEMRAGKLLLQEPWPAIFSVIRN